LPIPVLLPGKAAFTRSAKIEASNIQRKQQKLEASKEIWYSALPYYWVVINQTEGTPKL